MPIKLFIKFFKETFYVTKFADLYPKCVTKNSNICPIISFHDRTLEKRVARGLFLEKSLGDHGVDSFISVHNLGNP